MRIVWNTLGSGALIVTLAVGMTACAGSGGGGPAAVPDAYLCCTLRFNPDREALDAGYHYADEILVPAGTRVRVNAVDPEDSEILFSPENEAREYKVIYRFGRRIVPLNSYASRLISSEDPGLGLQQSTPAVRDAIKVGALLVGMTKHEAMMARGIPPQHRTPTTDGDEWLYYRNGRSCQLVRFVDGRISTIEDVAAPALN